MQTKALGILKDSVPVWVPDVNESGGSLSNWTQQSGTWTVVSGAFDISSSGAAIQRLRLTAVQRQAAFIYQADMKMKSTGGYGNDNRVGLVVGWDGSTNCGGLISLRSTGSLTPSSTGQIYVESQMSIVGAVAFGYNFALDTYYTMTVVVIGNTIDIFVNGVFVVNCGAIANVADRLFLALYAYNTQASFRNIKTSVLSIPTIL